MKRELRKDARFENIGRVECESICPLPGVLEDISLTGCRVHFPSIFTVDMENDYQLRLKISFRNETISLDLICHPQWQTAADDNCTELGFKFLRSPDTPELNAFISELSSTKKDESDISDLLIETPVTFIN